MNIQISPASTHSHQLRNSLVDEHMLICADFADDLSQNILKTPHLQIKNIKRFIFNIGGL